MSAFQKGFGSDNHSGVHPQILDAISEVNTSHAPSYGTDPVTKKAVAAFRQHLGPETQVYFVFNGTAANVLSLKPFVRSYHSVICSDVSHLHSDECAAPEFHLGSKLLPLTTSDGKITPEQIKQQMVRLGDQHQAQPRLVSITQPTELGTVYTLEELKALRDITNQYNLYLHMDGARLPNAAVALGTELSSLTQDIGLDVLSFGGTKNGLLGVDAVVFFNTEFTRDFKFLRKQSLQLPSKMRFLTSQFYHYLTSGLWREIAGHSNAMAKELEKAVCDFPEVTITQPVQTNVVFARIPKAWVKPLRERYFFYVWNQRDWTVRWMTSFDTQPGDIADFHEQIKAVKNNT